jgi:hypothetical protein
VGGTEHHCHEKESSPYQSDQHRNAIHHEAGDTQIPAPEETATAAYHRQQYSNQAADPVAAHENQRQVSEQADDETDNTENVRAFRQQGCLPLGFFSGARGRIKSFPTVFALDDVARHLATAKRARGKLRLGCTRPVNGVACRVEVRQHACLKNALKPLIRGRKITLSQSRSIPGRAHLGTIG